MIKNENILITNAFPTNMAGHGYIPVIGDYVFDTVTEMVTKITKDNRYQRFANPVKVIKGHKDLIRVSCNPNDWKGNYVKLSIKNKR
jgi:hypothetical protein